MVGDFIEQTKQVLINFSVPGSAAVVVMTDALKVGISKFPTNSPGTGFSVGAASFRFSMAALPGAKKEFDNSFEEAQDYLILSVSFFFMFCSQTLTKIVLNLFIILTVFLTKRNFV